jgi:hypothetical protein
MVTTPTSLEIDEGIVIHPTLVQSFIKSFASSWQVQGEELLTEMFGTRSQCCKISSEGDTA